FERITGFGYIVCTADVCQCLDREFIAYYSPHFIQLMGVVSCKYQLNHINNVFIVAQKTRFFSASASITSKVLAWNTFTPSCSGQVNDVPRLMTTLGLKTNVR